MNTKNSFFILLAISILIAIGFAFWKQEVQYALPTPIPTDYRAVATGEALKLRLKLPFTKQQPVLLHFFNPACPCSRFNLKHFRTLVKQYGHVITFCAVVPEGYKGHTERVRQSLGLSVAVIADEGKQLARSCGVYSTPQAALIDAKGHLYYRGNYNKSRYCTLKNTSFAQRAIDSLLAGSPAPLLGELATRSYGCELPNDPQTEPFFPVSTN
jgi:peroxiredoxin